MTPGAGSPDHMHPEAIGETGWAQRALHAQLAILDTLTGIGVGIAEALGAQVSADRAAALSGPARTDVAAIALAFDRVARAVRMGIALKVRLIDDLLKLENGQPLSAQPSDRATSAAEGEGPGAERDAPEVERLEGERAERRETDGVYAVIRDHSADEVIDIIGRDLGLPPRWREEGGAEAAREGLARAAVGEPPALRNRPPRPPASARRAERWRRAASP